MSKFPKSLERLLEQLQQLPTVGPKTASRLAFYLLGASRERVEALARAMVEVKVRLNACSRCGNLAEGELCEICRSPGRSADTICVVANARDLMAMENSGEYAGLYHVLGGLISPLDGIGPEQLNIDSLQERLSREPIKEVILATNPTVPGEATALYIKNILSGSGVKLTRLASGLPMGSDLEYADPLTLSRALGNRCPL
ncbi:MAG: recombination mediator RecR [Candidatus Bruticola sp.]